MTSQVLLSLRRRIIEENAKLEQYGLVHILLKRKL